MRTMGVLVGVALVGCGSSVDVAGTVMDTSGCPAVGTTVVITDANGVLSPLTVDAAGVFRAPNVATPYTAAVLGPFINGNTSGFRPTVVYVGLTRANPSLLTNFSFTERSANIAVTIDAGYPASSDGTTSYFFLSSQAVASTWFNLGFGPLTDSVGVYWIDPASIIGTLYASQTAFDAGVPVGYGYGATAVSVTDGQTTNSLLDVSPVSTGFLSGTIAPPAGYGVSRIDGFLTNSTGLYLLLFHYGTYVHRVNGNLPKSFSYLVPSIPGAMVGLQAVASDGQSTWSAGIVQSSPDASMVSLNCPAVVSLTAPAEHQTGVTLSTHFSWSTSPGAIYQFNLQGGGIQVWTANGSLSLPDLRDAGPLGFPVPSATYNWFVSSVSGYGSVDALTDPTASLVGLYCGSQTPTQDFTTSATP